MKCSFCANLIPRGRRALLCLACQCVVRRSLARMARGVCPRSSDRTHAASMMRPHLDDPAHQWMAVGSWLTHVGGGDILRELQYDSARAVSRDAEVA